MSELNSNHSYDDRRYNLDVLLQHYGWSSLTLPYSNEDDEWIFCYQTDTPEDDMDGEDRLKRAS